ncbi:preprotein translocase subunit YajC [Sinomonas mesophila]|uniref:preprotein translocase subunit YajC n=1 Tax=Sinomonas mesophila TaxID=1531955 RepID=UPI000984BD98|nr:preprotein translocase subunit YajC [Sinomonas mesophila]
MTILLLAVFAFFIFSMFRRNKKAQQQQAEMQSKFGPGVEVMTSFGLYGRIVEIDDAENKIVLELSPGNNATVHRQAVTKVVEPAAVEPGAPAAEDAAAPAEAPEAGPSVSGPSGPLGLGKPAADAGTPQEQASETPEETLKRLDGEDKNQK